MEYWVYITPMPLLFTKWWVLYFGSLKYTSLPLSSQERGLRGEVFIL